MKGIQDAGERSAPNSFQSNAIEAVETGQYAMQTLEHGFATAGASINSLIQGILT